jgi:ankyrin repeat protein
MSSPANPFNVAGQAAPSQKQINAFVNAATRDGLEEIRLFLDRYDQSINVKDSEGRLALVQACRAGRIEIVSLLLERGAAIDRKDDCLRRTPLMSAVCNNHLGIIRVLLDHDASLDIKDNAGRTAIELARLNGFTKAAIMMDREVEAQKRRRSEAKDQWIADTDFTKGLRDDIPVPSPLRIVVPKARKLSR